MIRGYHYRTCILVKYYSIISGKRMLRAELVVYLGTRGASENKSPDCYFYETRLGIAVSEGFIVINLSGLRH
jgi:hypothetical protein